MFKEQIFKTATGRDWTYTEKTFKWDLLINERKGCTKCNNFVPIENVEPKGFMGLQERDLGLCVRTDPQIKIVTISYQPSKNCKFF